MLTSRELLILSAMAVGDEDSRHTRTQLTQILFLLDREAPQMFGGPHFEFAPSVFGPRGVDIDAIIVSPAEQSLVIIRKLGQKSRLYRLSLRGAEIGGQHLNQMDASQIGHLAKLSAWVKSTHIDFGG